MLQKSRHQAGGSDIGQVHYHSEMYAKCRVRRKVALELRRALRKLVAVTLSRLRAVARPMWFPQRTCLSEKTPEASCGRRDSRIEKGNLVLRCSFPGFNQYYDVEGRTNNLRCGAGFQRFQPARRFIIGAVRGLQTRAQDKILPHLKSACAAPPWPGGPTPRYTACDEAARCGRLPPRVERQPGLPGSVRAS